MEAMDEDHPFELEVSIALSADVLQMPDLTENSLYRCKPAIMSGMPKSTDYCSLPRSALGPRSATMHSALPLLSSVRHATPGSLAHKSQRIQHNMLACCRLRTPTNTLMQHHTCQDTLWTGESSSHPLCRLLSPVQL